jgi:hypothetical protein
VIISVDADSRDTGEAEHLLHELLGPAGPLASFAVGPVVACTHVVTGGDRPHVAISISTPKSSMPESRPDSEVTDRFSTWASDRGAGSAISRPGASEPLLAGPSQLVRGAYVASVEAALGTAGRLVRFPGQENARGILRASDLRKRCGIDLVEPLGGLPVDPDSLVDTLDFVRPIRRAGQVVLLVQPAAGGVLIPFEVEHQQKCCADH